MLINRRKVCIILSSIGIVALLVFGLQWNSPAVADGTGLVLLPGSQSITWRDGTATVSGIETSYALGLPILNFWAVPKAGTDYDESGIAWTAYNYGRDVFTRLIMSSTAITFSGAPVAVPDAVAATDAVNRQTGDGRYGRWAGELSAAPGTPTSGMMYYNTSTGKVCIFTVAAGWLNLN